MGIVPFPHCFSLGPGINGLLPQHQLVLLYTRTEKIGRKKTIVKSIHICRRATPIFTLLVVNIRAAQ